jgi:hypothetical protein
MKKPTKTIKKVSTASVKTLSPKSSQDNSLTETRKYREISAATPRSSPNFSQPKQTLDHASDVERGKMTLNRRG